MPADSSILLPGLPVHRAVRIVGETLARERSIAAVIEMVERVTELGEEQARLLHRLSPPDAPLACRAGCGFCCRGEVVVTPVELIRLVTWVRAHAAPAELAAAWKRVREARAQAPVDRFARRCPLLAGGRCLGYPARPFVCRGANSLDASLCERAFTTGDQEGILPTYPPQLQLWHAVRTGVASGLVALGYPRELLSLASALAVALEDGSVLEAWVHGEPVFAQASDRERPFAVVTRAE